MGTPVNHLTALLAAALLFAATPASAVLDPTEPPKTRGAHAADPTQEEAGLAWVRVNGANSVAWYGGTTVKLGEAVEGGRVTAIREDHIVISGKGIPRKIYLLDHALRTESPARARPTP